VGFRIFLEVVTERRVSVAGGNRTSASSVRIQSLIPCNIILLEQLTVTQLFRDSPLFMESEGSLQCSQEPATGLYPQPNASGPHISLRPILILIHIYAFVFRVVSFLQVFQPQYWMHFSALIRATCFSNIILLNLTILITFSEVFNLRSSSLCSFLQPPPTSSSAS